MSKRVDTAWGGRFSESPDEFMVEFGASIDVDIRLLDVDIQGSMAWAKALLGADIISEPECNTILSGLVAVGEEIASELSAGSFAFDRHLEDVHMTVEARLRDKIGDAGAKLHTGRSRNDQVALDERLYLRTELNNIIGLIRAIQRIILNRAKMHTDHVVPSYTHLQQALPVRLAHYLMAWFWMLERDLQRFADASLRLDVLPLGSGAAAGSAFDIDRDFLARELGFTFVSENSIDATSDRDYIVETISAASILMMHLSRISEDLIIWSTVEFGFATLSDRYSTGSSMMPQKKNPDSLELVRGKTGRVYGDLMAILTVMKGLPFCYAKDMQEDKEPLFDALDSITGCLRIVGGVIEGVTFNVDKMKAAFDSSVFATDIADYLTRKGLPFRHAHEVSGRLVKWAQTVGMPLSEVPLEVFKEQSKLFEADIADIFDLHNSTDLRSLEGGTGKNALIKQFNQAESLFDDGEGE